MTGPVLRVTPADLAAVAARVRSLGRSLVADLAGLRPPAEALAPPDPRAAAVLSGDVRLVCGAVLDVRSAVVRLVLALCEALDGQAAALARAGHDYRAVEDRVGAASRPPERRHD